MDQQKSKPTQSHTHTGTVAFTHCLTHLISALYQDGAQHIHRPAVIFVDGELVSTFAVASMPFGMVIMVVVMEW